jgi:hypothetical protein
MRVLLPLLAVIAGCGPHERVPIGRDLEEVPKDNACALPAIDPEQLTLLGPSDRSHWLQPWRAYRDTWPARRMLDAPGFQPEFPPDPSWLSSFAVARFKHITLEVTWNRQTYDAPETVTPEVQAALTELANQANQAGLRPMLLLDAPHLAMPLRSFDVTLLQAAAAGSRTLRVTPEEAMQLEPNKTLFGGEMTPALVKSRSADGTIELSRPLVEGLAAGSVPVRSLRYAPFSRPRLADGTANPEYEATLSGWLAFLTAVSSAMREALGSQDFDIELWNETSSGNNFELFDINAFYDPPLEADRPDSFEENLNAIRERSASWLKMPERNLSGIGISDGSGNMRFSVIAATEPQGITAMSRHLSAQGKRFPEDADQGPTPSLDALGNPNGALVGETWQETFTPDYAALFPEQSLTALYPPDARRPPQLVRDLAPIVTTDSRGLPHQRAPLMNGAPAPDVWLTAASLNLGFAQTLGLTLTPDERLHLQAKSLLRMFSSYVGAGAGMISIYGPDQETVRYFDLAQPQGGEALAALGRFFARFESAETPSPPRELELVSVASCNPGREFAGDGTAAHPDLGHRELVSFFPFQRGPRSFVAPAYVMTRNVLTEYGGAGSARFDMPAETFELTLAGVTAESFTAMAYDPLFDTARPVTVINRSGDEVTLSVELSDYPVLLEVQD